MQAEMFQVKVTDVNMVYVSWYSHTKCGRKVHGMILL